MMTGLMGKLVMIACGATCTLLGVGMIVQAFQDDDDELVEEETE